MRTGTNAAIGVAIGVAIGATGCKSRQEREQAAPTVPVVVANDAAPAPPPPPGSEPAWPELGPLPRALPVRTIVLPTRDDQPRFDVGGPAITGDLAIVASSQFGFAAVDWRRGAVVWTKPAGLRVAPPAIHDDQIVLIGACLTPPDVPDGHTLLGCMRVVAPSGTDLAYFAIHGKARAVDGFAGAVGAQQVWIDARGAVRWRRGEASVSIDATTGVAVAASSPVAPVVVEHQGRRWEVTHDDGRLVARSGGKIAWRTDHEVTAMLGAVWLPDQLPMIRMVNVSAPGGDPELRLLDIDATGSLHGQASWTAVPGIGLLGHAISPVGDVALAVRLDRSITRDFLAAYAANALLIWVYPLPVTPRADPVGVAIALDPDHAPAAVVAFHDGDTVTVLPPLSSPPTAAGAARAPSENTTP